MREALFIKKNKDRWEKMVHLPSDDIDEMAGEFTQLVDDLGFSKTFYQRAKPLFFLTQNLQKDIFQFIKIGEKIKTVLCIFLKQNCH